MKKIAHIIAAVALLLISGEALCQDFVKLESFDQQLFTVQPDGRFLAPDGQDFVLVAVPDVPAATIQGHLFLAYDRNAADEKHCYHNTEYKEEGAVISISGTSIDLSKTFFVEAINYTVRFEVSDGQIRIYAPTNLSVERFSDFAKYLTWKHYFRKDGSVNPKMQSRYEEINSRLNLACVAAPLAALKSLGL